MLNSAKDYENFIRNFLKMLEEMCFSPKFQAKDPRFLSDLRTAERTFNFVLDQFPPSQIESFFGNEEWHQIKIRRDKVARKVSEAIDSSSDIKSRYVFYCEQLKNTKALSNRL